MTIDFTEVCMVPKEKMPLSKGLYLTLITDLPEGFKVCVETVSLDVGLVLTLVTD